MLIEVDTEARTYRVGDVDDLKRFGVRVVGEAADLAATLDSFARVDDDGAHVWVDVTRLRAACDRDSDTNWQNGFAAMVAYAASKGWLADDGTHLRAHVDYPSVDSPHG